MSEEMNQQNQTKQKCSHRGLVVLVIISLLMSIASLTISILGVTGNIHNEGHQKQASITKKYDKGQSLEKALKKDKPTVVFFYVNWCGFCQRFAPTYAKLTKDSVIKKNFAVAYVNCEDQDNAKLMAEYGIEGFPSVFFVKDGKKTHIDNNLLFTDDAVEVVKNHLLELNK